MLEILLVISLCKTLGKMVEAKGHKKGLFCFLLVVLWIGGELGGAFLGALVYMVVTKGQEIPMLLGYLFALLGAAFGSGFIFLIAYLLPDAAEPDFDADFHDPYRPKPRESGNPYQSPEH